jgi:hypothetical protein
MRRGSWVMTSTSNFKQPSRWYYRVQYVTKYAFGEIIYGMKSIPNFMKNYRVIKCPQTDITAEGQVRLVMHMRRRSWVMASSSSYLIRFSLLNLKRTEHRKTTDCGKLQKCLYALIFMNNIAVHDIEILFLLFRCPSPAVVILKFKLV